MISVSVSILSSESNQKNAYHLNLIISQTYTSVKRGEESFLDSFTGGFPYIKNIDNTHQFCYNKSRTNGKGICNEEAFDNRI